jgi:hypothetical protein
MLGLLATSGMALILSPLLILTVKLIVEARGSGVFVGD